MDMKAYLFAKLAGGSSMPVMTASGNPKLDTAPGQGSKRNPATPPTGAYGNPKIDTAPGQGSRRNSSTPPMSASGNPTIDSSPYGGERGMGDRGGTTSMTKDASLVYQAGFSSGMEKAAFDFVVDPDGVATAISDKAHAALAGARGAVGHAADTMAPHAPLIGAGAAGAGVGGILGYGMGSSRRGPAGLHFAVKKKKKK